MGSALGREEGDAVRHVLRGTQSRNRSCPLGIFAHFLEMTQPSDGLGVEGANAVVADINLGQAEFQAARLEALGISALAVAADVVDKTSVEALVAAALSRFGKIDGERRGAGHHNSPFKGLHARIDQLISGHHRGLERLIENLAEPRRAVDLFGSLFARPITGESLGMATGETMAHLNYLWKIGTVIREPDNQGVFWWRCR